MMRSMLLLLVVAVTTFVSGDADNNKPNIGLSSKDHFTKAIQESNILLFVYSSE